MTPTSTGAFYISGVWRWLLLPQLSREKTNYVIKQLLTIEVLDMTLLSTTEYQYWPRLLPWSVLVFSGGYHVISITSIVNNNIIYFNVFCVGVGAGGKGWGRGSCAKVTMCPPRNNQRRQMNNKQRMPCSNCITVTLIVWCVATASISMAKLPFVCFFVWKTASSSHSWIKLKILKIVQTALSSEQWARTAWGGVRISH